MKETADLLPQDTLQKVFQDRMTAIEHKCADDIHELLLERLDLFHEYTPDTKEIVEKLQVIQKYNYVSHDQPYMYQHTSI